MPLPPEDPPAGVPDWVLTYGDMMSLLLCFFILLAGMSEIKKDRQSQAVIESILDQFGSERAIAMFHESLALNRHHVKTGSSVDPIQPTEGENKSKAVAASQPGKPGRKRLVKTIREGRRQTIGGPVLFEPGTANLTPDAKAAMHEIADTLRGKRHILEVRAYESTAPLPPDSPYQGVYDLSYARAKAVVDFLADEEGIRRAQIRLAIAAPIEKAVYERIGEQQPLREFVTVQTAEASTLDYESAAEPGAIPTARSTGESVEAAP